VGAVFGLATGMRGVAGPTGLAVVGSVFGIAHLAARRWLAPLLVPRPSTCTHARAAHTPDAPTSRARELSADWWRR
jgi:hypothetical protein